MTEPDDSEHDFNSAVRFLRNLTVEGRCMALYISIFRPNVAASTTDAAQAEPNAPLAPSAAILKLVTGGRDD